MYGEAPSSIAFISEAINLRESIGCTWLESAAITRVLGTTMNGVYFVFALFLPTIITQISTSRAQMATAGMFQQQSGLTATVSEVAFSCSNIAVYSPTFTSLGANIPGFKASTSQSCHYASLGPSLTAGSCRWVPQTFLGMMYDRGVELMRHNIPQRDAFQV
jgi:hypothetical protein